MDKLKPCPFCGGDDIVVQVNPFGTTIWCSQCDIEIGPYTNAEYAVGSWNKRPPVKEADAILSDLAAVDVPEDPYEGDGEPDDDLDAVARADKWYDDCKKLCVTMRPLIERAKKVRGTDGN